MTKPPDNITYAIVVLQETVRISLTLTYLNYLSVKVPDTQNAYITAPVTEKIWTVLGREVGEDYDMKAIVVRSLCGMKSAGAAFRNHLADCIHHMELLPCPDDPDLWVNPMIRPEDGFKYYAYVLKYVYDVMVIHHDAES